MHGAGKKQIAQQLYESGYALLQEHRNEQALIELRQAEDLFRKMEARGHPFGHALSNGISGLANTLYLQGLCHQKNGDPAGAITCYETSLINANFERKRPFARFLKNVRENLTVCYEKELERLDASFRDEILKRDPALDVSFRFPFSLDPSAIPIARLYELAPERYPQFRNFYERARKKDALLSRTGNKTDEATMRTISISVWGILVVIWFVYGLMVVKTLMPHQ